MATTTKRPVLQVVRKYARFIVKCCKAGEVTQTEIERRWMAENGTCAMGWWQQAIDIARMTYVDGRGCITITRWDDSGRYFGFKP